MNAAEIMTPDPIGIGADASVSEAVKRMEEEDVRHLPVVHEGHLVGIISDRDLMQASGWLTGRVVEDLELEPGRVRDLLSTPMTVAPEDPVGAVAALLVEWGIGCAPVVKDGALQGIVTEMDLLSAYKAACRYGRLGGDGDPRVFERMTAAPSAIDRGATLGEAAKMLESADFRHIPITEAGRLIGLVSDRDVRTTLGRGELDETPVAEFMQSEVLTTRPDDKLSYAAGLMVDMKFSSVPVEEDGRLVGMLTSTDVLRHCARVFAEPAR